ncbi:MAG TPA: hypothetical protein VFG69_16135 [Nannocystaceae bacterium]|nr:hypothetical protein [Nannocystaceae bacterium]
MGIAVALVGLVALLQGVAWLGGSNRGRLALGAALAPIGVALLAAGTVHALLPTFVAG